MTNDEFERMNTLSLRAINNAASENELKEFNKLVESWSASVEFNLNNGITNLRYIKAEKFI